MPPDDVDSDGDRLVGLVRDDGPELGLPHAGLALGRGGPVPGSPRFARSWSGGGYGRRRRARRFDALGDATLVASLRARLAGVRRALRLRSSLG